MSGWASARLDQSSVIEMNKINLAEKFSLFDETWTPKLVGELNGQHVKLAKIKGEFVWHTHDEADEMFLVIKGSITIRMRDQDVILNAGEFFIVPRGLTGQCRVNCSMRSTEHYVATFARTWAKRDT